MKREIKFRGLKSDCTWIYGDLCHINGKTFIFPEDGLDSPDNYKVDPETVGQFTGLKDKNGIDIYEGDIVIWNDGGGETELNAKDGWIRKAVVRIDPSLNFELTKDTPSGEYGHKFHFGNFIYTDTRKHLKVIGTILDKN